MGGFGYRIFGKCKKYFEDFFGYWIGKVEEQKYKKSVWLSYRVKYNPKALHSWWGVVGLLYPHQFTFHFYENLFHFLLVESATHHRNLISKIVAKKTRSSGSFSMEVGKTIITNSLMSVSFDTGIISYFRKMQKIFFEIFGVRDYKSRRTGVINHLCEIRIINYNHLVCHQTHTNSIKPSVHLQLVFHQILTSSLIQEVDDMEYYYLMCFLVSLIDSTDFLTAWFHCLDFLEHHSRVLP